jgi:hypothetical protein
MKEGEFAVLKMGKISNHVLHRPSAAGGPNQSNQYVPRRDARIDNPEGPVFCCVNKLVGN